MAAELATVELVKALKLLVFTGEQVRECREELRQAELRNVERHMEVVSQIKEGQIPEGHYVVDVPECGLYVFSISFDINDEGRPRIAYEKATRL